MSSSMDAVEMSDDVRNLKDGPDMASREVENCPRQENGQQLLNGAHSSIPGGMQRSLVIRFKAPRDSSESVVSPVSSVHSDSSDSEEEDAKVSADREVAKPNENGAVETATGATVQPVGKDTKRAKSPKKSPGKSSPKAGEKRSPKKSSGGSKKSYLGMITTALSQLKEKNGASLVAIRKHVMANNKIKPGNTRFNQHFSATLKKAVTDKVVVRIGARYKLSDKVKNQLKAERYKKKKPTPKKSIEKAKAPPKVELTAEEIKARKKQQDKLRKEREMKEYKASLPKQPAPSSMDAIPNQYFTEVMAIAEFCNEFAKPIKLATFTVDMFYKALIHDSITFLIRDIHFAMLDTLLNGTDDKTLLRLGWNMTLNILTWQEVLRQYIVYCMIRLGETYPDYRDFEVAVARLSERDYCALALRTKLAILRVLSDDLLDVPVVQKAIEKKIEGRTELGRARWKLEQEHREQLRGLKKRKLDLMDGKDKKDSRNDSKKQKVEAKDEEETESEGYASSDEEAVPMSSRQKEACLRANERNMNELGRKREESARDYQRKKMDLRVRAQPLGTDSRSTSFWMFEADRKRLYLKKGTRWQVYKTRNEFDQLVASLDKYNPVDKQLKDKLQLFYDRISRRLPKEKEEEKPKADEKEADDDSKDEDDGVALVQKIRPQRVSARRAQEAIRDTTKGTTATSDEGDKRKQLQRQQTRSKQEEDPNAFSTYRNFESNLDGDMLTTMTTADARSIRSVEDGQDIELVLSWLVAEVRAMAQSVNDSGGKFKDFRAFSASIDEIAKLPEGKSTRLPKRNRLKLRKCLLDIEAAAVPVVARAENNKSDRRKSKKRAEAEEDNPVIKGLDDVDKALYEKALQYRYGLPVLCEIQVPMSDGAIIAPNTDAKASEMETGESGSQANEPTGERSDEDVEGVPSSSPPAKHSNKAAPGFKIELLPGNIVRFRAANFSTIDTGFDSWEVLLEDGDVAFLNEEQLTEAIQLGKSSDTSGSKPEQTNEEYETDFAEAPLWKLRCKRDHWTGSLDNVSSASSAALAVYDLSRQMFVANDAAFRRKRKPLEITL